MLANAFVIRWARWSKLPAHPTQNKISGDSPFAIISAMRGMCIICALIDQFSFFGRFKNKAKLFAC
jgi:hypothetical protein